MSSPVSKGWRLASKVVARCSRTPQVWEASPLVLLVVLVGDEESGRAACQERLSAHRGKSWRGFTMVGLTYHRRWRPVGIAVDLMTELGRRETWVHRCGVLPLFDVGGGQRWRRDMWWHHSWVSSSSRGGRSSTRSLMWERDRGIAGVSLLA